MIEINLVPEQLRKKKRAANNASTANAAPSSGLSKEATIGILIGFVVLLVLASIGLQGFITVKVMSRNELKKQEDEIAPGKKNVEKMIDDMKTVKAKVKTLEDVLGKKQVFMAQKLNEVSDHLPRSVWLTKIAFENDRFIIEGSAVSKTRTEINDVHMLATRLKESKLFMEHLRNLEVEMIKTRNEDSLAVADFTIKAELEKETK